MKITLKDGVVKEFDNAVSVLEIAKSISEGLARNACAGIVDGEVKDLRFVVDKDAEVSICTFEDEAGKMAFRHTASHILAQAVKRLYPEAKIAIGPAIADGFYYDFDREKAFTQEELEAACKKASIHEFIKKLPQGYETQVGELGDTLSGGERQRLGLARAFLHDAPFMLLDEPTSNLDSLNEAVILKSLEEERNGKTVVLVSHRESTMQIADVVYSVERGRMS